MPESTLDLAQTHFRELAANPYPGRGIVLGESSDGKAWVQVYWIMGRSENSRNRIFRLDPDGSVRTQAHDPSKLTDPSLIIYHPARSLPGIHLITNGDQTDTLIQALASGHTFEQALATREYEPDAPNYTPRISGLTRADGSYALSILKTANNAAETGCLRQFFHYERPAQGLGHLISTYAGDGTPLPSFQGEPRPVPLAGSAREILDQYWNALNPDNRISLLVRWIDKATFAVHTEIRNRLD